MFWFKKREPNTRTKITYDVIFIIHMKNGKVLTKTYKHSFCQIFGVQDPSLWKFKQESSQSLFLADDYLMYVYNDIDFVGTTAVHFEVTYIPGDASCLIMDSYYKFVSEKQIEVEE